MAEVGDSVPPPAMSGARRSIARGGAWSTVAWVVSNACGGVNTILLVRSMERSEYGVFVMAASTTAIVGSIAAFGLAPAVAQLAPRAGSDGAWAVLRLARKLSVVLAGAVALLTGIACLVLDLTRYGELSGVLAVMLPISVTAPLVATLTGLLQTTHQPKRLARAQIVSPIVLTMAVVALCLVSHPKAIWVAAARVGATLLLLALLALAVQRASAQVRRPGAPATAGASPVTLRRLVLLGASLLGGTVTAIFLAQLDVLLVGFSHGRAAVALYGPASQIADNAMTMVATVGTFYLPTIATVLTAGETTRAGDLYRWASRWAMVWVAPVLAVMFACPRAALTLLFGSAYGAMSTPLRILAAGVLANVVFGFNGLTVDSLNKIRLIIGRQAIAIAYNLAACAVLVPLFGADGAATATASSLLVMNLTASLLLYRELRLSPGNPRLLAVVAALAASVAVGLLLGRVHMGGAWRVILVGAIAAALCGATGFLVSNTAERKAIRHGVGNAIARVLPGRVASSV